MNLATAIDIAKTVDTKIEVLAAAKKDKLVCEGCGKKMSACSCGMSAGGPGSGRHPGGGKGVKKETADIARSNNRFDKHQSEMKDLRDRSNARQEKDAADTHKVLSKHGYKQDGPSGGEETRYAKKDGSTNHYVYTRDGNWTHEEEYKKGAMSHKTGTGSASLSSHLKMVHGK